MDGGNDPPILPPPDGAMHPGMMVVAMHPMMVDPNNMQQQAEVQQPVVAEDAIMQDNAPPVHRPVLVPASLQQQQMPQQQHHHGQQPEGGAALPPPIVGVGSFSVDEASGLGVKKNEDKEAAITLHLQAVNEAAASGQTRAELAHVVLGSIAAPLGVKEDAVEAHIERKPEESAKPPPPPPPPAKKKPAKPVKKVLVAKKETDIARTFLKGKRDLSDTLSGKECMFLANKFWVFTHEQLDFIVKIGLGEEVPAPAKEGEGPPKTKAPPPPTRDQVLAKIEASDILEQGDTPAKPLEENANQEPAVPAEASTVNMEIEPHPAAQEPGTELMDGGSSEKPVLPPADGEKMAEVPIGIAAPELNAGISSEALRAAAEAKLHQWKELLEDAKAYDERPITQRFPLSGAVSVLLTQTTRNFLATVKIHTLFAFMSLKKTETGAICDFLLTWRKKFALGPVSSLGVAKYLLGVNARIEAALSSIPPIDEDKRNWMMDPIIVMTGASREFLIEDQKILTAFDFVHTRTKDLSLALAAWRQKKGFVPLKGSGKVAMISGWKATAKEVLEVEAGVGSLLEGNDLEGLILGDIPVPGAEAPPPSEKKPKASKPARPSAPKSPTPTQSQASATTEMAKHDLMSSPPAVDSSGAENVRKRPLHRPKSEYDLHSKLFLDDTIGVEETNVLASVGIHTAAQLFEADDDARPYLADEIIEADFVEDIEDAEALIEQWILSLKDGLDLPEEEYAPRKRPRRSSSAKRTRGSVSPIRSEPSTRSRKTKLHHKNLKSGDFKNVSDPFELLSAVTKKFLKTVGISTAEQFLTSRTTDIAAEFVTFRKNEGMPELKGLGSIASVSGWKANCRKYCLNMGMDDIADLEPPDKFATKDDQEPKLRQVKKKTPVKAKTEVVEDEELPFSTQRRVFGVQGAKELDLQFRFDLSLRTSVDPTSRVQDIFVTFKGSSQRSNQQGTSDFEYARLDITGEAVKCPILQEALLTRSNDRSVDIRATFSSSEGGEGLVDLTPHGVRPLVNQDLSVVMSVIRAFVKSSPFDFDSIGDEKPAEANVVVKLTSFEGCQFLLNVVDKMEGGQTCPVVFPAAVDMLKSNRFETNKFGLRHLLVESFQVLSRHDVRELGNFLTSVILGETEFERLLSALSASKEDPTDEMKQSFSASVTSRLRLHWLSCHLFRLASARTQEEEEQRESVYFGMDLLSREHPPFVTEVLKSTFKEEFTLGVLGLLDFDSVCGGPQREGWCPLVHDFFHGLIAAVTDWDTDYPSIVKKALADRYEKIDHLDEKDDDGTKWVFKVSPLGEEAELKDVVVCGTAAGLQGVESSALADEDAPPVAVGWYKSFLQKVQHKIIHACGFLLKDTDFPCTDLLEKFTLSGEFTGVEYGSPAMEQFPCPVRALPSTAYQPQSNQFFLGIVWPTLREFGWRVEVVNYPSESRYIAPQWKGDQQKQGKLAKLAKQQRDRRRSDLARAVNQMGLGTALPKLTRRLLIATKPSEKQAPREKKARSTKKVAEIVKSFLKENFNDKKFHDKAKAITELVLESFDEHAPGLCKEVSATELDSSKAARDLCSVDVFMQFLLVLPSLLTQSELQLQEINDSLQVVQDLTAFCSEHSARLFSKDALPPVEHYATDEKHQSDHLAHRFEQVLKNTGSAGGDELIEVIWEEDKKVLSDFVVTVMEQVVACRATEEDTQKKHRKIHVGYPGAVCRHCMGEYGEGRYFFTTIESLTTLGTVFEKHFAKCTSVPTHVKKKIAANKAKHHEQRKHLPSGSQQQYFLKLWDRLRTMRISGGEGCSSAPITQPLISAADEGNRAEKGDDEDKMVFTDPLEVLDFLRNTPPWSDTKEIDDAINQYYTCIDFGGRIFNTRGMPKHFSPAWLLAKVGPKQTTKKRKNMPG